MLIVKHNGCEKEKQLEIHFVLNDGIHFILCHRLAILEHLPTMLVIYFIQQIKFSFAIPCVFVWSTEPKKKKNNKPPACMCYINLSVFNTGHTLEKHANRTHTLKQSCAFMCCSP